jgi:hypothetical protein
MCEEGFRVRLPVQAEARARALRAVAAALGALCALGLAAALGGGAGPLLGLPARFAAGDSLASSLPCMV